VTHAELSAAVEAAVDAVDFTPPVSAAYCQAVYDELGRRVPGAIRDVCHRYREVYVEVRVGQVVVRLVLPCS
jgi:hypothetical protein